MMTVRFVYLHLIGCYLRESVAVLLHVNVVNKNINIYIYILFKYVIPISASSDW